MRGLILCLVLLLGALPAWGQADDEPDFDPADVPTFGNIGLGQIIEDTLTLDAFFDRWTLYLESDETIRVTMTAFDGLRPLLGVSTAGGDIIASSDTDDEGFFTGDAAPNSIIQLDFTAPIEGQYTLVATRVDLNEGVTTGRYTLSVQPVVETRLSPLTPVEFRCQDRIATTALAVLLDVPTPQDEITFSVYGEGDLMPMVRVQTEDEILLDCTRDGHALIGDVVTLPDSGVIRVDDVDAAESAPNAASYTLTGLDGMVEVITAGAGRESGRLVIVITGLELMGADGVNSVRVRLGAANITATAYAYMVRVGNTRLDPIIVHVDDDGDILQRCDDAGRRDCAAIPTFAGAGVQRGEASALPDVRGGALDAGLSLMPQSVAWQTVRMGSSNPNARGAYALVIITEFLPVLAD